MSERGAFPWTPLLFVICIVVVLQAARIYVTLAETQAKLVLAEAERDALRETVDAQKDALRERDGYINTFEQQSAQLKQLMDLQKRMNDQYEKLVGATVAAEVRKFALKQGEAQ